MRDAKQTEVLLSQQDKYLAKEELPVSRPRNLICFSIIYFYFNLLNANLCISAQLFQIPWLVKM